MMLLYDILLRYIFTSVQFHQVDLFSIFYLISLYHGNTSYQVC
jgi:hypothetical protein